MCIIQDGRRHQMLQKDSNCQNRAKGNPLAVKTMTGIEQENQVEGNQKRAPRGITTDPSPGEDLPNVAPTRRSTRARKATDIFGAVEKLLLKWQDKSGNKSFTKKRQYSTGKFPI